MHESELSKRLVDHLRKDCKALVFKIHGHTMQQPGIPDFYLATDKFSGWIETKGAKTRTTDLQITILRQLRKLGVPAYVLRFKTDRCFVFETPMGDEMAEFTFEKWADGAMLFLNILYDLEQIRKEQATCGARTDPSL